MKVAVSIPDIVFRRAEQLARQRRWSRSRLYAEAIREFIGESADEAITGKLNAVYDCNESSIEPALNRAQLAAIDDETW